MSDTAAYIVVIAFVGLIGYGIYVLQKEHQDEKKRKEAGIPYDDIIREPEKPTNPNLAFCPDCHKEVSKNANTCIHCGCNLKLGFSKFEQNMNKASRGMFKLGCSLMMIPFLIIFLIILYVFFSLLAA